MEKREFLKERAEAFFNLALYAYKHDYLEICAFNLEQSIQLYLKYLIWKKLGDFEKTHSIYELLNQIKKIYPEKRKQIEKIEKEYAEIIDHLEVIYIESRYLPVSVSKSTIKEIISFRKKIKDIFKNG